MAWLTTYSNRPKSQQSSGKLFNHLSKAELTLGFFLSGIMGSMDIKSLILDMDGVIWRDSEPIGDLQKIFTAIAAKGLRFVFATNNSTKSVDQYIKKLAGFGIQVKPDQIFTSAKATAHTLAARFPKGGNVFIIGMQGLTESLKDSSFSHSPQDPLAVVAGMDTNLTFEKLRVATLLIRAGAPFIGTNPDKSFPSPDGLIPGAGSMLAAIEAATDVAPEIIGKPKPIMFQHALEYLGTDPQETLVVGDRLETDIAGGQAAGCQTGFVLTGASSKEQGENWNPPIDYIAADFSTLVDTI